MSPTTPDADHRPGRRTARRHPLSPWLRTTARGFYWAHLWFGVLATFLTLVLAVTGIALNHKRGLGLMPDPARPGPVALRDAHTLADFERLARIALARELAAGVDAGSSPPEYVVASAQAVEIDRMDVRPGHGLVKVRFDDVDVTEVTLALADGAVLHVGARGDVFMEKLHSGEIFGDGWILLSDGAAVALLVLTLSGLWLWLFPRFRT